MRWPARTSKKVLRNVISRSALILLAVAAMAGCASINSRWDDCAKGASTFIQLADCTVESVNADAGRAGQPNLRMRSELRAKRYAQKAEELMEQVGTGRMPDAEARVVLRRALDELMDEERDERLQPIRQPAQSGMICSPVGNTVACRPN